MKKSRPNTETPNDNAYAENAVGLLAGSPTSNNDKSHDLSSGTTNVPTREFHQDDDGVMDRPVLLFGFLYMANDPSGKS